MLVGEQFSFGDIYPVVMHCGVDPAILRGIPVGNEWDLSSFEIGAFLP